MDFGIMGAITGLIGAGLQASAQQAQLQLQYQQLIEARKARAEQKRFASAARSDAYGNKTSYDDLANEWKIALTPTQGKISKSGEREQLLQLTEDAPEARKMKRALSKRAKEAAPLYNDAVTGYRYDQPKSEAAIKDELTSLIATNNQAQAKQTQATLGRQAIRLGRGKDIPKLIKATNDELGQGLAKTMLAARTGAQQEHQSRVQAHDAEYLPRIQMYAKLMEGGGMMPPSIPTQVQDQTNAMINNQQSAMLRALESGNGAVGQAYQGIANAAGKSPDLSSLVTALSRLGIGKQRGQGGENWVEKDQDRLRQGDIY